MIFHKSSLLILPRNFPVAEPKPVSARDVRECGAGDETDPEDPFEPLPESARDSLQRE